MTHIAPDTIPTPRDIVRDAHEAGAALTHTLDALAWGIATHLDTTEDAWETKLRDAIEDVYGNAAFRLEGEYNIALSESVTWKDITPDTVKALIDDLADFYG